MIRVRHENQRKTCGTIASRTEAGLPYPGGVGLGDAARAWRRSRVRAPWAYSRPGGPGSLGPCPGTGPRKYVSWHLGVILPFRSIRDHAVNWRYLPGVLRLIQYSGVCVHGPARILEGLFAP